MIETLIRNWWLLFLRGVLALSLAVMAFLMLSSVESFTLREFAVRGMVVFLGILAVIAGVCTIAAGMWKAANGKWWLLFTDGIVIILAGFTLILADGLTFRTVTHTIVVLATAIGVVELGIAFSIRRHVSDEWFLALGGAGSIGFALAFLLIGAEEAGPMLIWLGSYSAFSAVCMLGLSLRLRRFRASIHQLVHEVTG
jgi:uncharacterized membrane protein HdeD (DUF308 family)